MPPTQRSIACLVFDGVCLLDAAGPLETFSVANHLAQSAGHPAPYRVGLFGLDARPVRTSLGIDLVPGDGVVADAFDTLLVPGAPLTSLAVPQPVVDWLARNGPRYRRLVSICTGSLLLAEAGLLRGRAAAGHWRTLDRLAAAHPEVRVDRESIYVVDGRIWTSAGMTSGIDLALGLVQSDCGHALALQTARDMVVYMQRAGNQAQFSMPLMRQTGTPGRFEHLHAWVREHLAEPLDLPALARAAHTSARTLSRNYRAAAGITPLQMVTDLRLEAVCQALAQSHRPIKAVAADCGFGSERTLRRLFTRRFGVAPSDYRARFAAPAPQAGGG